MSTFIEYNVDQGATFKTQISLKDDTGLPINLGPYVISGQVRRSYTSGNVSANLVCTTVDSSNGLLQLSLSDANTANVKAGRYVFDVQARNNSTSETIRLIEGVMIFTPEVTR